MSGRALRQQPRPWPNQNDLEDTMQTSDKINRLADQCEWFSLANVLDDDQPTGRRWEATGINDLGTSAEQAFSGSGSTPDEALDAALSVLGSEGTS